MNSFLEQQIYEKAHRIIGFRIHFAAFLMGVMINWIIWIIFPTTHIWPIWPTLGWSIGIIVHYLGVFYPGKLFSIEKEVNKINRKAAQNEKSKKI